MSTMIAAYNSSGCIGRCDAKCYDAEGDDCNCICGGANHGKGKNQAAQNTGKLAEEWLKEYGIDHPFERAEVFPKPVQLELLP